jgi:hypothetical protein
LKLTYSWLPFRELLQEPDFPAMLHAHWVEGEPHKEACPHDPDFQTYVHLDDSGLYRVWQARDGDLLVGYLGMFVQPHLQSRALTATSDAFTLLPAYRGHYSTMLSACEGALRDLGVVRWLMTDHPPGRLAPVYLRKGFVDIEHVYAKVFI